jgi:histidinol-phosphate aminotransferase
LSFDLSHHGDVDLVPGLVDLAVNVRSGGTPGWLAALIRGSDLAAYPDPREAVAAVAARHGRAADEVLLTTGAADALVLLARALRPRRAVVVHPQFTEPEAALRAAGHQVDRVLLPFPFTFDPAPVPADADLVFIGNPTNPTSVAHPRAALLGLVRPGRIVVIDEAFAVDTGIADIRDRLLRQGFAVRRGDTFPGLGPGWIRVAVRDTGTSDRFSTALKAASAQRIDI